VYQITYEFRGKYLPGVELLSVFLMRTYLFNVNDTGESGSSTRGDSVVNVFENHNVEKCSREIIKCVGLAIVC
jgi:hypothetical protein